MKSNKNLSKKRRVHKNIAKKEWRLKVRFKERKRAFRYQIVVYGRSLTPRPWAEEFEKVIIAPESFSLIDKPEDAVLFIENLYACLERRISVFIDLSRITHLTYDAILALLSIVYQFQRANIYFDGNFPLDKSCSDLLKETGFFKHLFKTRKLSYDMEQKHITRMHSSTILGEEMSGIISKCHKNIWGVEGRCKGVYRILQELMQNTHAHAKPDSPGSENWWLSVNYDEKRNTECFSFIDYGVGVFSSLSDKPVGSVFYGILERVKETFHATDNGRVLMHILNGEMHRTATGKYYRGKGLPGIMDAYKRHQISRLVILTNDAYGAADKYDFKPLHCNFSGTFIYWELSSDCQYHYENCNS